MIKSFIRVRLGHLTVMTILAASLLDVTTAFAKQTNDTPLRDIVISQNQKAQITIDQRANMWDLTVDDYKQYLTEMANTPSSRWWKDIDPPQVLGMNAKTEEERMKYARIDVQLDKERTSREIAFQHAYDKAFASAYPNSKPININTSHHSDAVKSSDRFYLFTPLNDPEGALLAAKIIRLMQDKSEISLNIFFVGKASFSAIQRWGKANNIPKAMPNLDQVTLNHNEKDKSNMLQHILKSTKVTLPLLVRVRGGQSDVMTLTSL